MLDLNIDFLGISLLSFWELIKVAVACEALTFLS